MTGSSPGEVNGATQDGGTTLVTQRTDDEDLSLLLLLLVWVVSTMLLRSNRALPSETVSIRILTLLRVPSSFPSVLQPDTVTINGEHKATTDAIFFSRADGVVVVSLATNLECFLPAPPVPLLLATNFCRTASVQSVATNG